MAHNPHLWLPRVTVRHDYIGPRSFRVSAATSVGEVKQLLYEETDLPVKEQQLTHNGKMLHDRTVVGSLAAPGSPEISVTLEGRGLRGGGRFGQTTPPLVEFLKDILRRYPEGGQILKELIQNAEDAGATEVKFMFDETEFGVESLWSPDMAQHQGPALYVYNDAVFTAEDWNGIQEIARSRKRDDPLKIGRFGIGFNSVYHISDVPSIFSGDQIAMLDPHQTLFGVNESGQCWNLRTDMKEISELADQFAPYVGLFGISEETMRSGSFPGTLFRFPLRMSPTQLSSNIYNKEKILELFESFKADADTVLLFLKSVARISLHLRESDGTERMLFQVTAHANPDDKLERPNSLKTLGKAIDRYNNCVLSSAITCVTYQVSVETQDETTRDAQRTTWLVCNGVGGRGMCTQLDSLADDLRFMPCVGIALPLTPLHAEDKSDFSGRAFCFLPLPPGEESETGLPVHVSGFFGLTDNRRSIKWREVDQWRDPAAVWNELLMLNVIPQAYSALISDAIRRVQTKKDQDFVLCPEGTYAAWPEPRRVRSRWKPALQPLFHLLLQQAVIYSLAESWVKAEQAVFSDLDGDDDTSETVINYLQCSGLQLAKVPAAVDSVLEAYMTPEGTEARRVTPALLRQVIRKHKHRGSAQEKLRLLEFVLSDSNYSDLIGLELLPLQDETFTAFSSSVTEKDAIYIASEEFCRSLYPGLEGRFVLETIKPSVMETLKTAAKSRGRPCTQLQVLNPERSARLIKEVLSTAWPARDFIVQWEPGNRELRHPTIYWLKAIWKHLYIHFAESLSTFEDLPLIPLVPLEENMDKVQLLRLKTPSPIVLVNEEQTPLPTNLLDIMERLGAVVMKRLDSCLLHPLLKNYIHAASPNSLLQIMSRLPTQRLASHVSAFSVKEKLALRRFLSGLSSVSEKEKHTLLELSIFEKIGSHPEGTSAFTSLRGARALHHQAKYPPDVKLSQTIVGSSDEESIRLIKLLHVEQVKTTECVKLILQDIERGFYTTDEVSQITLWALRHLSFLKSENPNVVGWLAALKFIQMPCGKLVTASELFDPELKILQNLFYMEEESRFPSSAFTSSPDILHSLRQLGLRNEVQLSEKDVLQVAKKIEELQGSSKPHWEPIIEKAKTLLQILNKQTKLVKSSAAQASLLKWKWVPACKERPPTYPKSLAWVGDSLNICSLSDMCDISHAVLVGSSVAVVQHTSAGMKKALKLTAVPHVDQVLQHLKAVNDWHKSQAFNTEDWYQFQQILFEIYNFMQAHLEEAREAMKSLPFEWVWTGKTFASPGKTVLKPLPDLDLQPYLHSLPKTMRKFHKLFKSSGSVEEVAPSHVFEVISTIQENCTKEVTKEDSKRDVLILINSLRWLYKNQIQVETDMHVPIYCYKDPNKLSMKPIHECTYCDIKVDDLNDLLEDSSEPIILVHDDIPMKTAEWLKVPCLSTRLINPENLGFEQSGQREPLTVRIKNILEEYPSVADIFKELLQNADDASATECSFLIDMRKNTDIRENLLDPGMMACHGPSLWSFNNSVFTDTDFLNITRLGGSVKRSEADKVGKFGLGFNSVYHITDIPIIMSREFMIMFDPNINHISKHIRDQSNPGIKINWSKQQKRLRKFPNQFKPFINVFNCQLPLAQDLPYKYDGTLFRLPFRTEHEASVSELSSLYYNTTDIYSLVDEFSICGHRFILFTQHVGCMVLKYLKFEEANPAGAQDVVTINKSVWSSKASYGPLSILKSAAKVMKKVSSTNKIPADVPKSGCIIRVVVEEFHNVFKRIVDLHSPLFRGSEEDPNQYFEMAAKGVQTRRLTDEMPQKAVETTNWLICSCMDVNEALKFSLSESGKRLGLVPCGGVAVLLTEEDSRKWMVKATPNPIGEVFCYLPLRIKTGLPVHINGCFAVTSNRKEIWKTDTKGQWNSVFMRHVIVQAYLAALSMLRAMAESGELHDYCYYAAWPDPSQVHDDFTLVSQGVYQEIAKGGDSEQARVFSDGKTWVSIKHVRFLDDALLCRPDIGSASFKIFLKYLKSGSHDLCAVELPEWVKEGFDDAGCKAKLMENTLTERQFFSDIFFPHIQEIDQELRDPLMHYVLNEKLDEFSFILRETPCIPCSGPRKELVLPSRLIHPEGRVAKLYNTEDGRFPEGTARDYLNPVCLVKLVQLGMVKDDLSWEDLSERAKSVAGLNENDHMAACFRSSILLSLIDEKLKMKDPPPAELLEELEEIKFLPFLTRPAGFSLPWYGNNFSPATMFCARDLFTTEHQDTVCLMKAILNENSPSFKGCGAASLAVKDCLGLIKKPSVLLVISQLKKLSQSFDGVTMYQENITNACYKFLHEEMLQDEDAKAQITERLREFNSVLVENTYVNPSKVAFHLNFDAAPHLYQLPNKYRNSCCELFQTVGVKASFSVENFSEVLGFVKQECGRRGLSEENFQLCRRIISEGIWSLIRDKTQDFCLENYSGILLPDSNLTLLPSNSLCYNDCPWIKVRDGSVKYCHADIPREVAVKLGAVPKRHKALERYASNICFTQLGSEFGQKEKLTSRIKSILNAYPSEKEMLKELLQNADDAKATEIYFVFDARTHPADRIFDDKWVPMQGPALCVYNNQPFTEDDVRGIQNLGRGTKEANPGKTGQYGIGFNSVYHITDCPSFISNNDILCIFDPHAQYAPGATSTSPGRMFRDLDSDFRSQFSDVLNLYLGGHFKLERSTMFRFPIRSKDMAKTSEISSVPASDRMVQSLLDKLKTDGAELLMFLNHMEKISICEIETATGELKVLYSVTAKISDGDRLKRKQFHASVIDSVTKKKPLTSIPVQQITYTMDIGDTDGNLTTWMICNRSGFPNMEKVSKSVISAHKNEDITLFPRGGVAACVSHNYRKPHRAFCFLPLALETGLPFHVNGHFVLDSARRNLWRDDNGVGVRSDWNNNLMTSLIAPACVELLLQVKRRSFPGPDPTMSVIQGTPLHVVKDTLRKFLSFFPANRLDVQPDWYCLVKAVYSCVHADLKRVIPVVRAPHPENSEMHSVNSVIYISWVNTSTAGKGRAYFDNLLQDELQHLKNIEYNMTSRKSVAENVYRLKTLLLDIGFNLVHSCDETANIYLCLEDAGIPVSYVTPSDVRTFLHTFSSSDTSCHVGKLPCRLPQSNYKLVHHLKLMVDYCFKDIEEDTTVIDGLPLLITMDNMLQVFDSKRPKFLTTHHELISQRKEMFMNTMYIKYSNILLKTGAAKVFDISGFGELLGSVLPREYRTKIPVRWRETFASESWLKNVWTFVSENVAFKEDQVEMKPTFDTVLDILKDWALIPGIKFMARDKLIVPEHDVLLPLSLLNIAIFPQGQNDKVFHTLMKAGCIQLSVNKICVKENPILQFLAQHTANIENPSSVLTALEYMIQTSTMKTANLTDKDFEALLLYFNSNLAVLTQQDARTIKLLPCFKLVSGKYVGIAAYGTNYVLAKSIPTADIDKWAHTTSFAFLLDNPQLRDLYNFLGCVPIDDLELYFHHLLPKFDNLSHDAKTEHVVYLKERLLSIEEPGTMKEQLFEKLKGLAFIYDQSNRLRPAKFFFDETEKVFEVMLPAKSFIPSDFFKKVEQVSKPKNGTLSLASWITFLRNIGLKHEVSQQQVLQFAKEVSIKSQTESWTKDKLQNVVEVLLNHIFNERTDLFSGSFLKELSMVPFLCPERAPKELIKLHSQYQESGGTLPLIRFSGSQVNPKFKQTDVIHLLWTACPILPEKATPSSISDQKCSPLPGQEQLDQVMEMLGVNLDPPLEKVINNCRNICNISSPDDEMVKTRNKVLRSTYEFLNAEKREFRHQLRGVAFVMVEDGWKLLKPEEVVINLDNESDFKPYLYKLPLELGTFHQLFKLLGTEDVVSTKQYVEVLWRIFRISEGKHLDPNEMRTVKRVVSGLFKSLHNEPVEIRKDLESLRDLSFYLPSHDGRLAKSSSLVFDDAPHYKSRIQGNIGVQMLVDMSQCYLGKDHAFHTKLIMLLPQKLRPKLLSSLLEEQLDEDSPKMCQFGALCSLQGRLQLLLSSEQFITGLIRIMKHENDNAYLVNEEKAIRLCKALCEGLKVSCFEKLQTTLRVKGCSPIAHSRSETLAFLKRYGTAVIHLYIQHSDSKDINFLLALAMTLKSATDNLISDTSYLIAMLGCNDIYRITEKLDNLGVKYDATEPSKLELPLPGTPIPAEIHHTLLMDPTNVFYPGEYVGYLVDSEGGDIYGSYQPTYTYAIIVQEVDREGEETTTFLGKCFQIDIGYSEYKIVSSLDLYKFSRQDESSHVRDTSAPSTPTSPECRTSAQQTLPPLFMNKEKHRPSQQNQTPKKLKLTALPDILKEVTLVVEQAWKLNDTERKKIMRRLYLKWHPDKNAENLEIATEVFKHLQNEINRMEKQSLDQQNMDRASRRSYSSSSARFQSEKFSFQRFYSSWNQEATSHKSERQQFREHHSSYAGSSHSQRFFVPPTFKTVGNPVEARRWLRQARANYSAARNDLHKNANEWVCFKCYLATKLALIAADYAVRGKSDKDVKPTALAQKVEEYSSQLSGLASDVQILDGYGVDSLRTRYPDLLPFPQIPNDRFTSEVAMRVMECTARIIIKLETFVQQKI
ncbi:sacsin isoform X1 [Synchiropus splendidus]|uniref:sacsin isoform X1 n=2 Tax=Synchiropus splendidus TaxID=270530 RepID=UPI00237D5DC8|nr:sacsin isoform X1 [Synchiropus splendidus]XP_053728792.1 sacsin isoform X1 [Synchiropus splendidus]XP_053728793.1 sacsin isoform X1 [Synchiropus splendidus]XP_053728794.1 sacsin isoform X1 [Synchiropus splendidus]